MLVKYVERFHRIEVEKQFTIPWLASETLGLRSQLQVTTTDTIVKNVTSYCNKVSLPPVEWNIDEG